MALARNAACEWGRQIKNRLSFKFLHIKSSICKIFQVSDRAMTWLSFWCDDIKMMMVISMVLCVRPPFDAHMTDFSWLWHVWLSASICSSKPLRFPAQSFSLNSFTAAGRAPLDLSPPEQATFDLQQEQAMTNPTYPRKCVWGIWLFWVTHLIPLSALIVCFFSLFTFQRLSSRCF